MSELGVTLEPMPSEPGTSIHPIEIIYRDYLALTGASLPSAGLGGKLVYAGDLALGGRELLFAANIAGAASLAASADAGVQRAAIRDGAVDFLVTSLEEALRILKNEVRKRQAVSVGVGVEPEKLVDAMLVRGVLPDLLISGAHAAAFIAQGAREIRFVQDAPGDSAAGRFVRWSIRSEVARNFALWLPRLDGCVQAAIPVGDAVRQRWLRLAPRYLGRMAQRERGVDLSAGEAARFEELALAMVAGESAAVQVVIDGREIQPA